MTTTSINTQTRQGARDPQHATDPGAPIQIALRPYQRDALGAIADAREEGRGEALVVLPTGTGKTVLFNSLIAAWQVPTVILAHREELLTQARDKLLAVWPGADVGIVGAGYEQTGHLVTVGSVQSLSRPKRLAWLARSAIRLIIVDECHHVAAASYRAVLSAVRAGETGQHGGAFHVGVTATPDRADGKSILDGTYGDPVYQASLPEMIRAGYLCNLRGLQVRTTTDITGVKTVAGDFAEGQLAAVVNRADRNEQIVDAWMRHASERQTIVFCASVEHAHDLAAVFRERAGVPAEALDGETPREQRRDMLSRMASGALRVVCNVGVLTEGFDQPAVSCVVLARPTQSRPLYVQCVGRGTRPAPGKQDCLVLDVADVSSKHKLIVQNLPRAIAGRRGYDADDETAEDGRRRETTFSDGEQDGGAFDVRTEIDRAPSAARVIETAVDLLDGFTWEPTGEGHYRMAIAGKATFWLVLHGTGYTGGVVWADGHRQELTTPGVPLDWAQTLCERAAIQVAQDQQHLVDKRAPWRYAPASEKQLDLLRKLRIRHDPYSITKGEAADLISVAFARSGSSTGNRNNKQSA